MVCVKEQPWLDGSQVVIGEVLEGLDFLDYVSRTRTWPGDYPIQRVTISYCGLVGG